MNVSRTKQNKHLFFDLDHTIWDFDRNAEEALHEVCGIYGLKELGLDSADRFIEIYTRNNHKLWAEYHLGKITKNELREARFKRTFLQLSMNAELIPIGFEDAYVKLCPTKTNLYPETHETLQYLRSKYTLHLISNGFLESTIIKIDGTGIGKYFQNVIISEVVGFNNPHRGIFEHAINLAGATVDESLMVGDSLEADVYGALNFGMDAIYFNPMNLPKPDDVPQQINRLKELTLRL